MRSIDAAEFRAALAGGAVAFDTRAPAMMAREPIPGTLPLSLEAVQAGDLPEAARDRPVYLICARGQISELVGLYLEAAGFREVYNVRGGVAAWRALPPEPGR